MGFRVKRSVPVSPEMQGYIYFSGQIFKRLPPEEQEKIKRLCEEHGGDNAEALFDFVTTTDGAERICQKYFIASKETLYSAVRKYYIGFAEEF